MKPSPKRSISLNSFSSANENKVLKKFILTIGMYCIAVFAFAQTYKGNVKDTNGEAIAFANVVFYSLPDSTFIEGTTTNDIGEFLLETKIKQKGYLKISFIGYETQTILAQENVGTVIMQEIANELGEVMVKAHLPKMQVRDDAFITTVKNSVLAKAGTANNVLQRLPMLTGEDGVYSVFGKGQAKIYINNREIRDVSELENLNSEDIKNVEIVTNPGARYDASVKAVVRIYTVKRVGEGFSFDIRSTYYQGINASWMEKLNVNYRKNSWDLFTTLSYNDRISIHESPLEQTVYVDTLWKQKNQMHAKSHFNNINSTVGVNYEISAKQFVGVKYSCNTKIYEKNEFTIDNVIHANEKLYDKWISEGLTRYKKFPKHILNAYYNGTFGKLNIDLDATYYRKKESSKTQTIETSDYFADRTINSRSDLENKMIASKLVVTYPVGQGTLSVGDEFANTNRDDAYWASQTVPSSTACIEQKSNSIFTEYSRLTAIGQVKAGLRYENISSDYFVNNVYKPEQSKEYNQWFSSFSLATQLKGVGMQLSYTSKTTRPTYSQLSNNIVYGNRFTLQSGNPFLSPSITHDITLTGSWKVLQLMLSYKYEKDAIIYWSEQLESNPAVSFVRYKNLNKLPQFIAYGGISPTFGIWSPQLNGGFQKQWLKLETNNSFQHLNKLLPFASLNNSFQFPKDFLFTIDMDFQGKGNVQNIYLTENIFTVGVGVTKTFFDNRLSIAIKGHDIFKRKKNGNLLYNEQMTLYQLSSYDSQKLEVTIRYKFNTSKSKYKGKGAGKSEVDRM